MILYNLDRKPEKPKFGRFTMLKKLNTGPWSGEQW